LHTASPNLPINTVIGANRMSALPRKQTCAVQLGMSALGQKRTLLDQLGANIPVNSCSVIDSAFLSKPIGLSDNAEV
jgi:Na+-transporting methylmalonyl-CoA/oxaloacetate decarboxylase beta subunit